MAALRRGYVTTGALFTEIDVRSLLCVPFAFFILFLVSAKASLAGDTRRPVKSLLETRQEHVVMQKWDLSCGAATLATLLQYQYGDPVTEREVARGMMQREEYRKNPEMIKERLGFSLLDLKRYADRRGYVGIGYGKMTFNDLIEGAPVLIPILANGYSHFVVFRGVMGNRVLLADPGWGNRTMTKEKFEIMWLDFANIGKIGFVVMNKNGEKPPVHQLLPRQDEFLALF